MLERDQQEHFLRDHRSDDDDEDDGDTRILMRRLKEGTAAAVNVPSILAHYIYILDFTIRRVHACRQTPARTACQSTHDRFGSVRAALYRRKRPVTGRMMFNFTTQLHRSVLRLSDNPSCLFGSHRVFLSHFILFYFVVITKKHRQQQRSEEECDESVSYSLCTEEESSSSRRRRTLLQTIKMILLFLIESLCRWLRVNHSKSLLLSFEKCNSSSLFSRTSKNKLAIRRLRMLLDCSESESEHGPTSERRKSLARKCRRESSKPMCSFCS